MNFRDSLPPLGLAALLAICTPAWPQATPAGADPKINERFYDASPGDWLPRFEGESREIYAPQ